MTHARKDLTAPKFSHRENPFLLAPLLLRTKKQNLRTKKQNEKIKPKTLFLLPAFLNGVHPNYPFNFIRKGIWDKTKYKPRFFRNNVTRKNISAPLRLTQQVATKKKMISPRASIWASAAR
jgi:hypothetical protein